MTDEQTKKALECCINDDCRGCPTREEDCINDVAARALDLINRQKAEIDRLQLEVYRLTPHGNAYAMQVECSERAEKQIRAEAIKEFWERLKSSRLG